MANAIDRSEIKKVVKEIVEENLSRIIGGQTLRAGGQTLRGNAPLYG